MPKKKYELPQSAKDAVANLPDHTKRAGDIDAIDQALAANPPEYGPGFSDVSDVEYGPAGLVAQTGDEYGPATSNIGGQYGPAFPGSIDMQKALDEKEREEANAWSKIFGSELALSMASGVKALRRARGGTQRGTNKIKGGLGSIPIPGGIGIPLIIFIILWMALISINGHTRFAWLWLVLSGKAYINPKSVTGGTTSKQTPNPAIGGLNYPGATGGGTFPTAGGGLGGFLPTQPPQAPVNPAPGPFRGQPISPGAPLGTSSGGSGSVSARTFKDAIGDTITQYSNGTYQETYLDGTTVNFIGYWPSGVPSGGYPTRGGGPQPNDGTYASMLANSGGFE
jgi:hypothetical protein